MPVVCVDRPLPLGMPSCASQAFAMRQRANHWVAYPLPRIRKGGEMPCTWNYRGEFGRKNRMVRAGPAGHHACHVNESEEQA